MQSGHAVRWAGTTRSRNHLTVGDSCFRSTISVRTLPCANSCVSVFACLCAATWHVLVR